MISYQFDVTCRFANVNDVIYTFDANGNLLSDGTNTYAYDSANRLVSVINGQSSVTSYTYNGLGQRLGMDAAGVIAYYVMDNNRPLTATTGNDTTSYLYGLGVIGEENNTWSYSLTDGTNTQRQLTDSTGEVTYSARYTPWGDILETYGTGNLTFGYFGGLMDTATGLLYVGNGQYYDPATGRFLTRNAKPNQGNPYLPFDPTGAMLGPLGVLALVLGRKKRKSKYDVLLFVLVFAVVSGVALTACKVDNPTGQDIEFTAVVTPETTTITATIGPDTIVTSTPTPFGLPTIIVRAMPCLTPTLTPNSNSKVQWLMDMFGVELLNNSEKADEIWDTNRINGAYHAIIDVANKLRRATGKDTFTAFRDAFKTYGENLVMKKVSSYPVCTGGDPTEGGCTAGAHLIYFADIDYPRPESQRNNIVHELGHAFNANQNPAPANSLPHNYPTDRQLFLHNNSDPGIMWQSNNAQTFSETFADMFVAYTYDVWGNWNSLNSQTILQAHNSDDSTWNPPQWMDDHMKAWLN